MIFEGRARIGGVDLDIFVSWSAQTRYGLANCRVVETDVRHFEGIRAVAESGESPLRRAMTSHMFVHLVPGLPTAEILEAASEASDQNHLYHDGGMAWVRTGIDSNSLKAKFCLRAHCVAQRAEAI